MLYLACADEFFHRARNILNRHGRVNTVLIEEVDAFYLQSLRHRVNDFSDVFSTTVQPAATLSGLRVDVKAELRRDDHLVAKRRQRVTNEFFVREWTIRFSGIEEGDASLESRMILMPSSRATEGP